MKSNKTLQQKLLEILLFEQRHKKGKIQDLLKFWLEIFLSGLCFLYLSQHRKEIF